MDDSSFLVQLCGPYINRGATNPTTKPNTKADIQISNLLSTQSKSNFELYHKKTNLKFAHDPDSKRAGRGVELNLHRKDRRTEAVMAKRGLPSRKVNDSVFDELLQSPSPGINLNENVLPPISNAGASAATSKSQSKPPIPPRAAAPLDPAEARRQKLAKWKHEKNTLGLGNAKSEKKPPFKAGGPSVKPNLNQPSNPNVNNLQNMRLPPPAPAPSFNLNPAVAADRRVTRQMTKSKVVTDNTNTTGALKYNKSNKDSKEIDKKGAASAPTELKPTVSKLRSLVISTDWSKGPPSSLTNGNSRKPLVSASTTKLPTKTGPPTKSTDSSKPINKTSAVKKPSPVDKISNNLKESTNVENSTNNLGSMASRAEVIQDAAPKIVVPKKLKPKAIDQVYIDHNSCFSKACESLTAFSKHWKKVLETSIDIPEDIRDDIISAVGKVKLLLDSKLPQFGQLLYSYLCKCKEMDPGPILECDLQGWWDVANIQIVAITSEFENLSKLEHNGWIREEVLPKVQKKKVNKPTNLVVKTPVKTSKASKGMREFLTMKRKAIKADGEVENLTEKTIPDSSLQLENKFEGGFFQISSPSRKGSTPGCRSSARRMGSKSVFDLKTQESPARLARRSSSNLALRVLSLRQSMGPIYKMGAKSDPNSESGDTNNRLGQNNINSNDNEVIEMDVCENGA